jgi:hypothetical protein
MKKIYSTIAILAISSLALLSSCSNDKKKDSSSVKPASPDAVVSVNESTNKTGADTIYVERAKLTATIQVNAVSTITSDMQRIYIAKKTSTTNSTVSSYYDGGGWKKDIYNRFYYEIPADERNNTSITLTVNLNANNSAALVDEYSFFFTDAPSDGGSGPFSKILVGPAKVFIYYGLLSETKGHKLNNMKGTNSGAFNLYDLKNEAASASLGNKDMIDADSSTAAWDKSFAAGNATKFVKLSNNFDYTNATDLSIVTAYAAGTPKDAQLNIATGNMFVAKVRGLNFYTLIKVTSISEENNGTGIGKNNEFMQFSVKK